MSVMNKVALNNSTAVPDTVSAGLGFTATDAADKMKDLGFAYKNDDNYYRVLSKTEKANPELNTTDTAVNDNTYSATPLS